MTVIELLTADIVKTPLVSKDKADTLRELVQILKDASQINDFETVLDAVQKREDQMSTGLQDGIAVPHCKTTAVTHLKMAIGIAPEGIEFDALDGKLSQLFFLLVAPPDQSGPHVEALAEIAKLAQSKAFCKALIHADDAQEVIDLMKGE
jgi:fructose-specific phosphotransferase system IIA component